MVAPFKVEQYVVGSVQTNCYFVINGETGEAIVIDPGASAGRLAGKLEEKKLKPVAILLTHGHFDHAGGAKELSERFAIKVYAHELEEETLLDPQLNLSGWEGKSGAYHADEFLRDGQEIDLAGFHIRVLLTPGHTVGGCCYYFPYQDAVFCGDTLFAQSVGRTDFPKGSASQLISAIREKLMSLPDGVTAYPGHGETTSIGAERMYNPYL